jgi:hypothetical protein
MSPSKMRNPYWHMPLLSAVQESPEMKFRYPSVICIEDFGEEWYRIEGPTTYTNFRLDWFVTSIGV